MRDRLIELLYRAHHNASCVLNEGCSEDDAIEEEARYLIVNNVIALSCKVGDKVYENYRNRIFEYVITSIEISSPYDILYKVQSTEPWNRWVRFIGFDKYDIGKTIFLTREEAEKGGVEG